MGLNTTQHRNSSLRAKMIQDLDKVADAVNYALVIDTYIMDIMRASFIVMKTRRDYLTMHGRIVCWIDGIDGLMELGENKLSLG